MPYASLWEHKVVQHINRRPRKPDGITQSKNMLCVPPYPPTFLNNGGRVLEGYDLWISSLRSSTNCFWASFANHWKQKQAVRNPSENYP